MVEHADAHLHDILLCAFRRSALSEKMGCDEWSCDVPTGCRCKRFSENLPVRKRAAQGAAQSTTQEGGMTSAVNAKLPDTSNSRSYSSCALGG
jgi:hypothetical protein